MPPFPPLVRGLEAVGWMFPASQTGGDCFDLWQTADGRLGILVADAAGHGLGAALIILQVRSLVRTLSTTVLSAPTARHGERPIICRPSQRQLRDGVPRLYLFRRRHSLDRCRPWPGLCAAACRYRRWYISVSAMPLAWTMARGADPSPPPAKLDITGSLMVVTDGIFEARNPAGQLFDLPRNGRSLRSSPSGQTGIIAQRRELRFAPGKRA